MKIIIAIIVTIIAFCAISVVFCSWALVQNRRAYKQMMKLVPDVHDPLFLEKMDALESVSYKEHLWELICLRDPMDLYPELLK